MADTKFGDTERTAAQRLIDLGLSEDLSSVGDLTCRALIPKSQSAVVQVVARQDGILSGEPIGKMVFETLDPTIRWICRCRDGTRVSKGTIVADVSGPLDSLLIGERTMLNFMTHLSGIASVTGLFVAAVAGTKAKILDTRKTLPGWRLLEKYAVRCGGGTNHRIGLFDGILIKDNHLAAWTQSDSIAEAVRTARRVTNQNISIEVEVDTLVQLEDALVGGPDIVLLDNMSVEMMTAAIGIRDRINDAVQLEASGGVTLQTVGAIAQTGVERISVGALTHSAPALDLAFDWASSSSN